MTTSPNTTRCSGCSISASSWCMIVQVISGLAIWKPVQFQELTALFYDFQGARLAHFIGMALIVGFLVVHVALALLVPKTLGAMITGGPRGRTGRTPLRARRTARPREHDMRSERPSPSIFRPQRGSTRACSTRTASCSSRSTAARSCAAPQPRRADHADRLRRHRPQRGAERAARGLRVERRRAGVPVQPEQARADLHRGAGAEAAALQRLLRHRGGQAGRRRELEARALRPHRATSGPGRRSRSTNCRSRS